jgi:hypothetical protein
MLPRLLTHAGAVLLGLSLVVSWIYVPLAGGLTIWQLPLGSVFATLAIVVASLGYALLRFYSSALAVTVTLVSATVAGACALWLQDALARATALHAELALNPFSAQAHFGPQAGPYLLIAGALAIMVRALLVPPRPAARQTDPRDKR